MYFKPMKQGPETTHPGFWFFLYFFLSVAIVILAHTAAYPGFMLFLGAVAAIMSVWYLWLWLKA